MILIASIITALALNIMIGFFQYYRNKHGKIRRRYGNIVLAVFAILLTAILAIVFVSYLEINEKEEIVFVCLFMTLFLCVSYACARLVAVERKDSLKTNALRPGW